jgi:hypothetical protein
LILNKLVYTCTFPFYPQISRAAEQFDRPAKETPGMGRSNLSAASGPCARGSPADTRLAAHVGRQPLAPSSRSGVWNGRRSPKDCRLTALAKMTKDLFAGTDLYTPSDCSRVSGLASAGVRRPPPLQKGDRGGFYKNCIILVTGARARGVVVTN